MTESQLIEVSPHECRVAGRAETGTESFPVLHPYDGTEVATVWEPSRDQVERAVTAACTQPELPPPDRKAALYRLADLFASRTEEAAELLAAENATPITAAEAEAGRSVAALRAAADEVTGYRTTSRASAPAWVRAHPRGPVLATTGGAHPLEDAARAVAATVAAGAPLVLVPDPATPLSALLAGELLADSPLPDGWCSVLPLRDAAVLDGYGELVRARYGSAPDATLVVCAGWCQETDVEYAARLVARYCDRRTAPPGTAVSRVLVDRSCLPPLLAALPAALGSCVTGSPHDPAVTVAPLPCDDSATAAAGHVDAALEAGYEMVAGGGREGTVLQPTVLAATEVGLEPWQEDIPGPVVLLAAVPDQDAATSAAVRLGRERAVALLTHDHAAARSVSERLAAPVVAAGAPVPSTWDAYGAVRELIRETVTVFPSD